MSAAIKESDLIEAGAIKAPLELAGNFDKATEAIMKLIEAGKKADINIKTAATIKEVSQSTEELTEREKELEKIEKRIERVQAQNNKEFISKQVELKKAQKSIRDVVNAESRLEDEYTKQSRTLRELKKDYKSQILIQGEATAETEEMRLKIIELDKSLKDVDASTGDFNRNVGDYKNQVSEAIEGSDIFGVSIGGLKSQFMALLNPVTATFAVIGALGKAYADTERGQRDLERSANRLKDVYDDFGNSIADFTDSFDFTDSLGNSIGIIEGLTREFQKLLFNINAVTKSDYLNYLRDILSETQIQEKQMMTANKALLEQAEIQRQIRDDFTNSFATRIDANERLLVFLEKRRDAQRDILEVQRQALNSLIAAKAGEEIQKRVQGLQSEAEKTEVILKQLKGHIDLRNELAAVVAELADVEEDYQGQVSEALVNRIGLEKEFNEQTLALTEARINEQIILAEEGSRKELDLRLKLVDEKEKLEVSAAKNNELLVATVIQNALNERLMLYKAYQKSLKDIQKAESLNPFGEDFDQEAFFSNSLSKLEQDIALRNELYNQDLENYRQSQEQKVGLTEEMFQKITNFINDLSFIIQNVFINSFQLVADSINAQLDFVNSKLDNLEDRRNYELSLAGRDAEKRAEIEASFLEEEKRLQKERADLQRKQAITEKAIAISQSIISTAQSVAQALTLGPILGPIAAVAIGAIGGLQIATIASTPIPQFEKGTLNAPEGMAIVNEKGPELIEKNGKFSMIDTNKPTLTYLEAGTKVYPHNSEMTQKALMSGLSGGMTPQRAQKEQNDMMLGKKLEAIERAVKNQKQPIINMSKRSVEYAIRNGQNITKLLNTDFK